MQRILSKFLKSAQSLLAVTHFDGRRNPKRRRRGNCTDPLEERCLLALGDVLQTFELHAVTEGDTLRYIDADLQGDVVAISSVDIRLGGSQPNVITNAAIFNKQSGSRTATLTDPTSLLPGYYGWKVAIGEANVFVSKVGLNDVGGVFQFGFGGNLIRLFSPPELQVNSGFGETLAAEGDLVLVGAPRWQSGEGTGATFLYRASTGALLKTFSSPNASTSGSFGASIAIYGEQIAVSDPLDDANGSDNGAVFVFAADGRPIGTFYDPNELNRAGNRFGDGISWDAGRLNVTTARGVGGFNSLVGGDSIFSISDATVTELHQFGSLLHQGQLEPDSGINGQVASTTYSTVVGRKAGTIHFDLVFPEPGATLRFVNQSIVILPAFPVMGIDVRSLARAGTIGGFNAIATHGESLLVASAFGGKAFLLENFGNFDFETTSAPAGVTEFLLRRSGDMLQIVNQNDPQQVIASRALNSTSGIRFVGRPTDKISMDVNLDFQLPYLQRAMPISISNAALTLTGGDYEQTVVTVNGPDRMTIALDTGDNLASTIEYHGTTPVTNLSVPRSLSLNLPDTPNQFAIRDTGSIDDRVVNLVDNATNRTVLPYVFQLPYDQLSVNTGNGGDVVDLGLLPTAFIGQVEVQGGTGNDTLNSTIRPSTKLNFDGGGGSNGLNVGSSSPVTWSINGPNSGTVEQTVFSQTGTIGGGTQPDWFQFFADGSLSGSVDGGGGTNVIDYSQVTATVTTPLFFNLKTSRGSQFEGTFSQIQRVIGPNSAEATLTGRDRQTTWTIDSANTGILSDNNDSSFRFENFSKLEGGTDNDTFKFGINGSLGRVFGGSGTDTLSYEALNSPVDIDLRTTTATRLASGFDSIESFVGGSVADRITGTAQSSTWSLGGTVGMLSSGVISENVSAKTWSFDSFESFVSTGASDTLIGTGFLAIWNIDGLNSGNINSGIAFTGFENLTGSGGTNLFIIAQATGWLTGTLDGGPGQSRLDYSSWNLPTFIDRKSGIALGIGGGFTRLTAATGTAYRDLLVGKDLASTWILTDPTDGTISDGFSFTSFEQLRAGTAADTLIGADVPQIWTINQANAGSVGILNFSGFENLTGGTSGDQFNVLPSGALSGQIDGGAGGNSLSYSTWTTPVTVEQRLSALGTNPRTSFGISTPALGAGFANIGSIIGGSSSQDVLIGQEDFLIDGRDSGIVNSGTPYFMAYASFENLRGRDSDSVVYRNRFQITDTGYVSGNLNGGSGGGTLDYSQFTGDVTISFRNHTATHIDGIWSNITNFVGGSGDDTIEMDDLSYQWYIDENGISNYIRLSDDPSDFLTRRFTGIENIQAGSGDDYFTFITFGPAWMRDYHRKYVNGSIDGGGGNNSVELLSSQAPQGEFFGDITLDLRTNRFTPIAGTITNIQSYKKSGLQDLFTIIAPDTANEWHVNSSQAFRLYEYDPATGQQIIRTSYSGTLNGIEFGNFDRLIGSSQSDIVYIDNLYSMFFNFDGKGGSNTVVLPDASPSSFQFDYSLFKNLWLNTDKIRGQGVTALMVGNAPTVWEVKGHNSGRVTNANTPSGGLEFEGFSSILGSASLDTVKFYDGGRIDGRLSANGTFQPGKDIVDYSAVTTPVTVSVALSFDNIGDTTGVGGQMNGFGIFIGGQSSDTFVADTQNHRWDILGTDRGVINSDSFTGSINDPFSEGPAQFRFDSFENLVGGFYNDEFRFAPAGDITGTIDRQQTTAGEGNRLYYDLAVAPASPQPIGRQIDLERYRHVIRISGSRGIDTLLGPNAESTWNFGRDSFSVTSQGWTTYWDSGSLEQVQGRSATDRFVVAHNAGGFPRIDGGGGTDHLDLTDVSGPVAVDLTNGLVTYAIPLFGNVYYPTAFTATGIESYLGPNLIGSSVIGRNEDADWKINANDDWTYNGLISLRNFSNLTGGSAKDRIQFSDNDQITLYGSIDGGEGSNTLDYSLFNSSWVQVDLAYNISASLLNNPFRFQNIIGTPGDDVITVFDDSIEHLVDGGPHQFGDTLQYVSYGNGISRTPGGNADHGTVRSGSGAVTTFSGIEQFLTDGVELTGIVETSTAQNQGIMPLGTSSVQVRFSQPISEYLPTDAFLLFRLEDTFGNGDLQEIPVSIQIHRNTEDTISMSRINEFGQFVAFESGPYRMRIQGDYLSDLNGMAIDADSDGYAGGTYLEDFQVSPAMNEVAGTTGNDLFVLTYAADSVEITRSTNGVPVTSLGHFALHAGIRLLGSEGNDTVRVVGTSAADVFVLSSDELLVNNSVLTFDSVENMSIESGMNDDLLVINARPVQITSLTLIGGEDNDTYQLSADNLLGSISLNESQGGIDTLDFSLTQTQDVTVKLSVAASQVVNPNLNLILKSGATFENVIGGAGNDKITGNSLANVLRGGLGNDTLSGANGDDMLEGGDGNDTLIGGANSDSLDGGNDDDTLTIDNLDFNVVGGIGFDRVTVSGATDAVTLNLFTAQIEYVLATASTFDNVFDATGATWDVTIYGGSGNDTITGGDGNDTLNGKAGNDTIIGNGGIDRLSGDLGADSLDGGDGDDTIVIDNNDISVIGGIGYDRVTVSGATDAVTLNLFTGQIEYVSATTSTYDNVFDASGATWNVTIYGGSGNDTIIGGDGSDTLNGKAGNDTIIGNGGNDRLSGDLGADSLDGGNDDDTLTIDNLDFNVTGGIGFDRVIVSGATDAVNLNLFTGQIEYVSATTSMYDNVFDAAEATWNVTIYGGSGNDTIIGGEGTDTLNGKAGNDTIVGNGGMDRLYGDLGADSLDGGNDDDTLTIDNLDFNVAGGIGFDRVTVSGATDAVNLNLFTGQIEYVSATTSTHDNVFDATGATWDVTIYGGSGNDTIIGGDGNDTLNGKAGNDTIIGNGGNDRLYGDLGTDTVSYVTAGSSVNVNLTTRKATGGAGNDTLNSFENVVGSNWDDFIMGDANNNILNGLDGIDLIFGGGGIDTILNV